MQTRRCFIVNERYPWDVDAAVVLLKDAYDGSPDSKSLTDNSLMYFGCEKNDERTDDEILRVEDAMSIRRYVHVFATQEDAELFSESLIPGEEEIRRILTYIAVLEHDDGDTERIKKLREIVLDGSCLGARCDRVLSDILGEEPAVITRNADTAHYIALLEKALNGNLNVNGCTTPADAVMAVKWGDGKAVLVLKGGEQLTTRCREEMMLIEAVFGKNVSHVIYSGIK